MNEYTRIAKLLKETYEAELDKEIQKVEEDTADMVFEPSEKFNYKINKLTRRMNKPYWRFFNTASKRVACIIAAVFVISGAGLSVSAVREELHKFVTSIFSDHTEVRVSDDESSYPQTVEKVYEISSIPDGFRRVEFVIDEKKVRYKYFKDDKFIFFEQRTHDIYTNNYDNEYSEIKKYDSNGQEYLIIHFEIDNSYAIIWDNAEYVFEIASNLTESEILELRYSIKVYN